jgi:hypothetical protein
MGTLVFDIDGTLTKAGGFAAVPCEPPTEVKTAIQAQQRKHQIVLLTGQPLRVATGMARMLDLPHCLVAPDYGAFVCSPRNLAEKEFLINRKALEALMLVKNFLVPSFQKLGGRIDSRDGIGIISFIWECRDGWADAQRLVVSSAYDKFVANNGLRFQWNRIDLSMNVMPAELSKGLIASRYSDILVAAGDTSSDLPVIQKALFPIVTHDEGMSIHPDLAAVAVDRGYIASPEEHHGWGLISGLQAAQAAGILN